MADNTQHMAQETAAPDPPAQAMSVLQRKAQVGGEEHRAKAMSLAKALRLSVARVADETLEMAMATMGVRTQTCGNDALSDTLGEAGLLLLLDGPMRDRGAAIIDETLVGALIQQQTIGRVLPGQTTEPRKLTATDAAICAPFLNALLERAAALPETAAERALLEGFQFGAHVPDMRLLLLALQAAEYQVLTLSIDIAGGVRQGQLVLCMPIPAVEADVPTSDESKGKPGSASPNQTLEPLVMDLPVELKISLARASMPLRDLEKLKTGDTLDLGTPEFSAIRVLTRTGIKLASGTLGQISGQRAVEIVQRSTSPRKPQRRAGDVPPANLEAHGATKLLQKENHILLENGTDNGVSDLPNLPDVTDLPDLPDMSDLPDLTG